MALDYYTWLVVIVNTQLIQSFEKCYFALKAFLNHKLSLIKSLHN